MKKRLLPISLAIILLITLMPLAPTALANGEFTATIMGQLDTDVSDAVDEWGIGDLPDASIVFQIGEESTISMEFPEPIKFTGNWTGISTTIPVLDDVDAESTGAHITAFVVDGVDLGARPVPVIDRDGLGFLTIDIARQWGGDWDNYDLAGMAPFTSLEISFLIPTLPLGVTAEADVSDIDFPSGGNVWFAGTVLYEGRTDDIEPTDNDWYEFTEQAMPFEFGVPFTVRLDLGAETATHGPAVWGGYIFVVETDVLLAPTLFDAAIESIVVDGNPVSFDPFVVEVGADRGIRVPLTSGWADEPVLPGYHSVGTFSTLEVTLAIWIYDQQGNPFGERDEPAESEPTPTPPPIVRPDNVEDYYVVEDSQAGLPSWVIPVIIGGAAVIAIIICVAVIYKKRKK